MFIVVVKNTHLFFYFLSKVLPKKYRALPSDWYAQAGTTMHVAVFKRTIEVNDSEKTETTVYVSIVEDDSKQDGNSLDS